MGGFGRGGVEAGSCGVAGGVVFTGVWKGRRESQYLIRQESRVMDGEPPSRRMRDARWDPKQLVMARLSKRGVQQGLENRERYATFGTTVSMSTALQ